MKRILSLSGGQPLRVDFQGNDMRLHLPGDPPGPVASVIRVELK